MSRSSARLGRQGLALILLSAGLSAAAESTEPCHQAWIALPQGGRAITLLSDGGRVFSPALAVRSSDAIVVWNTVDNAGTGSLWMAPVRDGCALPPIRISESLRRPRRPAVAPTSDGFVLAWEAEADHGTVVRSTTVDADFRIVGEPRTVSAPRAIAARVSVAAAGDELAYAWSDTGAFHVARRGAREAFGPRPVGHALRSTGLTNPPHLELTPDGSMLLAWIDGGPESFNRDVMVSVRPPGGRFSKPVNVSRSPELLSIDLDVALDPDGTLNMVWVQQDAWRVDRFVVAFAQRLPDGTLTKAKVFNDQLAGAWRPKVAPGMRAVWHTGGSRSGSGHVVLGSGPPRPLAPGRDINGLALARDVTEGGALVVYVEDAAPSALQLVRLP